MYIPWNVLLLCKENNSNNNSQLVHSKCASKIFLLKLPQGLLYIADFIKCSIILLSKYSGEEEVSKSSKRIQSFNSIFVGDN
jgi:hypothetical protein